MHFVSVSVCVCFQVFFCLSFVFYSAFLSFPASLLACSGAQRAPLRSNNGFTATIPYGSR